MTIPPKYEDVVANLDAALGREAALRESLHDKREDYNKLGDRYDALQQRLTVSEQILREVQKAARKQDWASGYPEIFSRVDAALKPAAEGEGS